MNDCVFSPKVSFPYCTNFRSSALITSQGILGTDRTIELAHPKHLTNTISSPLQGREDRAETNARVKINHF
jgi:hypothetical protein